MGTPPTLGQGEFLVEGEGLLWYRHLPPTYARQYPHVGPEAFRLSTADREGGGTKSSGALSCHVTAEDAYHERVAIRETAGTWGVTVEEAMTPGFWVIDDHENVESVTGHASLDHCDVYREKKVDAEGYEEYKDALLFLAHAATTRGRIYPPKGVLLTVV